MKILIHKADHLGDLVLAFPALWELRQRFGPEAEFHLLVREPNAEWQRLLPWLGTLHPLKHPRYERNDNVPKLSLSMKALKKAVYLREVDFDWGIDLVSTRNDLLSKWLLWAAGCHQTSGPDGAYSWMLQRAYPEPVSHQTRLLAHRFPHEWGIKGDASPEEFMPEALRWKAPPDAPVLLAPFAGTAAKRWPEVRWMELFTTLGASGSIQVLVPKPDLERNREFLSRFPESCLRIVGTIRETLESLVAARGCVVLDTAVAHFAWLTGTPFLQLFSGTTSSERWAPSGGGVTLQNRPECYLCQSEVCLQSRHHCMEDFRVDDVLDAYQKLEEEW